MKTVIACGYRHKTQASAKALSFPDALMQKLGERDSERPVSPLTAAPSLGVQFFLIPLTVVAVVVAIYGLSLIHI